MQSKPDTVLSRHIGLSGLRRIAFDRLRMHLGFALLGLLCVAVLPFALAMYLFLSREDGRRAGRRAISGAFRVYLRALASMGACRFDLAALDALRGGPPVIIAPNHPGLLDAVMILSRLPDAACVMKADIVNSFFFGAGARLAGYISNVPLRTMIGLAAAELRQGRHLLLFPEGTRTLRFPVGAIQGTAGLIAKHSGVPVQTVFIETNSGFLGKGWSLFWTPKMPITYRVRLGKRFDPPRHAANFAVALEEYFLSELTHAQLPEFPVSAPRA